MSGEPEQNTTEQAAEASSTPQETEPQPRFDRAFLRQMAGFLSFSVLHPWFFVADRFALTYFYLVVAALSLVASFVLRPGKLKRVVWWVLEAFLFIGILPLSVFGGGVLWLTGKWWLLSLVAIWFILFRLPPLKRFGYRPGWLGCYYVWWVVLISLWYWVYALPHEGFEPEGAFTAHYPPSEFTEGHQDRGPAFPYDVVYSPEQDLLVAALKEKGGGLPFTFPADYSNGIAVVRTKTGERYSLPLPARVIPETIAIGPKGKRLYVNLWNVADAECNVMEVALDPLPPTIVDEVSLGENLQDIIFDRKNNRVLAFGSDRNMYRLSVDPLDLYETVPYERKQSFYQVGNATLLNTQEGLTAYISTFEGVFVEWDAQQGGGLRKVEDGLVLPRMAYDPQKERFYVTDILSGKVSVIDRVNMQLLTHFDVPGNPAAVAVAPERKLLFVADYLDGTLRVLDQERGDVVARGKVGPQVRALTYDPETKRIFGVSKGGVFEINVDVLLEKGATSGS